MDAIFKEVSFVMVYLNDLLISSSTLEVHVEHMKLVLRRIQNHGLNINVKKCELFISEVSLLGQIIDSNDVRMYPEKFPQ